MFFAACSRARSYALLGIIGFSALGCPREHTLFQDESLPGSAGAASGGAAGPAGMPSIGPIGPMNAGAGGARPWDKPNCVAALSAGKTGDACRGEFTCSAVSDCCTITVACKAESLTAESSCTVCTPTCGVDADCTEMQICEADRCYECPKELAPANWVSVARNSCNVLVPPNACTSNAECGSNEVCIAGANCLPGCMGDPSCCFGNQCAAPECGALVGVNCAAVGCPAGSWCKSDTQPVNCVCDPNVARWSCTAGPVNSCVPR